MTTKETYSLAWRLREDSEGHFTDIPLELEGAAQYIAMATKLTQENPQTLYRVGCDFEEPGVVGFQVIWTSKNLDQEGTKDERHC